MRLYHITRQVHDPKTKVFTPYVPESAADIEDRITKRISLSVDVEHCIQSVSPVDILHRRAVIRCYQYDMQPSEAKDFLPPYYLWKSSMVFDAAFNLEAWCLKEITMSSTLQLIENFSVDRAIDWYSVDYSALKSLIKSRYDITINADTCHQLYTRVSKELDRQGRYDEYDDLEVMIAETFPCQQHKIHYLTMRRLPESCLDDLNYKDGMYYLRR